MDITAPSRESAMVEAGGMKKRTNSEFDSHREDTKVKIKTDDSSRK